MKRFPQKAYPLAACSLLLARNRRANRQEFGWKVIALIALALTTLSACTNSRLVLRPLYNGLDDRIADRVFSVGEFTDEQSQQINAIVDTFHVWHRTNELPRYSQFLQDITVVAARKGSTSEKDILLWYNTVQGFIESARDCSPLQFGIPVMLSLSQEQIIEIDQRIDEQEAEEDAERSTRSPEQRAALSQKRITRYLSLAGLNLTDTQKQDLEQTFLQMRRSGGKYGAYFDQWREQFFEILKDIENPDRTHLLSEHLAARADGVSAIDPESRQFNQLLWQEYALRTLRSLSADQRSFIVSWLETLANTIDSLARDEPSYIVDKEASHGCIT